MNIPDAMVEKVARKLFDYLGPASGFDYPPDLLTGPFGRGARAIAESPDLLALGRAQGIEEAAKVCEEWSGQFLREHINDHYAAVIRALSPPGEAKP